MVIAISWNGHTATVSPSNVTANEPAPNVLDSSKVAGRHSILGGFIVSRSAVACEPGTRG